VYFLILRLLSRLGEMLRYFNVSILHRELRRNEKRRKLIEDTEPKFLDFLL